MTHSRAGALAPVRDSARRPGPVRPAPRGAPEKNLIERDGVGDEGDIDAVVFGEEPFGGFDLGTSGTQTFLMMTPFAYPEGR